MKARDPSDQLFQRNKEELCIYEEDCFELKHSRQNPVCVLNLRKDWFQA
jgi:hypothetical protein